MNKTILVTIKETYFSVDSIDFVINDYYKYKKNYSDTVLIHITNLKNINSILCNGLIPGFCKGINDVASNVVYFWKMPVNYKKSEINDNKVAIFVDKYNLEVEPTNNEIVVTVNGTVPIENIIGYIKDK